MALQGVSGFGSEVHLDSPYDTCSRFYRK